MPQVTAVVTLSGEDVVSALKRIARSHVKNPSKDVTVRLYGTENQGLVTLTKAEVQFGGKPAKKK